LGDVRQLSGIAAICGLEAEARLLRPLGIDVTVTAGDAARGQEAAARAEAESVRARVSFGIAGGLAPGLATGTLLLPHAVRTAGGEVFKADEVLRDALAGALREAGLFFAEGELLGLDQMVMTRADKETLFAQSGASAVDTESLFVAHAAARTRSPFLVLRAISDPAEITLPPATSVGLDEHGRPAVLPVLLSLLKNPGQLPGLIRAARDARLALTALEAARDAAATVFSNPPTVS